MMKALDANASSGTNLHDRMQACYLSRLLSCIHLTSTFSRSKTRKDEFPFSAARKLPFPREVVRAFDAGQCLGCRLPCK